MMKNVMRMERKARTIPSKQNFQKKLSRPFLIVFGYRFENTGNS